MIEIWLRNGLVSDKFAMPELFYKKWQMMLGLHLVLVTLHDGLQLVLSTTYRIGDTEYNI